MLQETQHLFALQLSFSDENWKVVYATYMFDNILTEFPNDFKVEKAKHDLFRNPLSTVLEEYDMMVHLGLINLPCLPVLIMATFVSSKATMGLGPRSITGEGSL